ncbi:hypothetical protein B0J15DRAFT_230839 [Fusarium solani]|uniref:Heterokaryon incompatibility domain-containing protein n=1 Tax=Fusarium solani TaxID=169388 RepID=A0A9P9KU17_FUSSL|nr:uncharacterized protein B0J15DRAFT_230839 [Fusarium solani]KAH7268385.1 hypothetical protein B0J15DRAFT_230839 [Fusarium solani]
MPSLEGLSLVPYRSLDPSGTEVRLLELHPASTGNINERLVCRLVHERLSDSSDFIGLSSLFGDINVTEAIQVNGTRVVLPANVAQALRYVRAVFLAPSPPTPCSSSSDLREEKRYEAPLPPPPPPKKAPSWLRSLFRGVRNAFAEPSKGARPPLRIWLDTLCINRRDAREEAERRSHMARAYRHAKMVVGWLGPKDSTSDLAIEIIRAWDKCMPLTFGEPGDRELHPENYAPTLQWMGPVAHLSDIPEGITDPREVPNYKAISEFLNRPYFRNTWMLDDMTMARFPAFLLGDDIVSWMQILRLNRVNEDIKDHGADMFPDHLRHLLEYMPLGSVYTFLKEFDMRQREEGIVPMMITATSSVRSSESISALRGAQR